MDARDAVLGERLADEGRRLARRHRSAPAWLDLLAPVVERAAALAAPRERFDRHEAAPRPERIRAPLPAGAAADDAPTDVWPDPADAKLLAANLRDAMRPMIGPDIDRARLHTGDDADRLARSHGADAVTLGTDVHFRRGAFDPATPAGRGLLAHELSHVAASVASNVDWRRSTAAGVADEEALAHAREHAVARAGLPPPAAPWPPALSVATPRSSQRPAPPAPSAAPSGSVLRAETGRPAAAAPPPAAMPPLDQLRDVLYRDIMARIRVDFERGA